MMLLTGIITFSQSVHNYEHSLFVYWYTNSKQTSINVQNDAESDRSVEPQTKKYKFSAFLRSTVTRNPATVQKAEK
jgi:hypothetical protein